MLILGGTGMLGHQIAKVLGERHDVTVCVRERITAEEYPISRVRVLDGIDLAKDDAVETLMSANHWSVIVNAAGLIKQRQESRDPVRAISINSLFPHRMAAACAERNTRLIHFSTDCVFSGARNGVRGEFGYRVGDFPDARDLYGLSKLLGEPDAPGSLCIRTSFIGRELRRRNSLLEWFLNAEAQRVPGYVNALFSGITTPVAARLVDKLIAEHSDLEGVWHVASNPISKYELLQLVRTAYGLECDLYPEEAVFCDRRLDGGAFRARTGWQAPPWEVMIQELAEGG